MGCLFAETPLGVGERRRGRGGRGHRGREPKPQDTAWRRSSHPAQKESQKQKPKDEQKCLFAACSEGVVLCPAVLRSEADKTQISVLFSRRRSGDVTVYSTSRDVFRIHDEL